MLTDKQFNNLEFNPITEVDQSDIKGSTIDKTEYIFEDIRPGKEIIAGILLYLTKKNGKKLMLRIDTESGNDTPMFIDLSEEYEEISNDTQVKG